MNPTRHDDPAATAPFGLVGPLCSFDTPLGGGTAGERLGPYRLVKPLGRGGMGEVWLAEHVDIENRVAIKLVLGDNNDPELARRFLDEARATARVRHPGIVAVSDFGPRPAGGEYLVMELLEGQTLADRLASRSLSLDEVLELGIQIADGLAAAHAAGIVHRDLKPSNVFLVEDPAMPGGVRTKLLDFGLAKTFGGDVSNTMTGAFVGTPGYMAPEQITSTQGAIDPRADLYAFGVVLFEATTGRLPFLGPTLGNLIEQHLSTPPARPRSIAPRIPPALETLILKLLAKRRDLRPASADSVARTLRAIQHASDATLLATSETVPAFAARPSPRPARGRRAAAACALVAVAVAAFVAAAVVRHEGTTSEYIDTGTVAPTAEASRCAAGDALACVER